MWNIPFYTVGVVNWLLAGSAWYEIYYDDEVTDYTEEEKTETLEIIESYGFV